MKSGTFFGKSGDRAKISSCVVALVISLSLGFGVFGCASAPTLERVEPARTPASILADFGVECLAHASLFGGITGSSDWDDVTPDPELSDAFSRMSDSDRADAFALALAEAYAYGQTLLARYDSYLASGFTHEHIRRNTTVYAELQALYFLRSNLERLASAEFAAKIFAELDAVETSKIRREYMTLDTMTESQLVRWREIIKARSGEPLYGTLALAGIAMKIGEMRKIAKDCRGVGSLGLVDSRPGSDAIVDEITNAAQLLPKDPTAFLKFHPHEGENGLPVVDLVHGRGREILRRWSEESNREPQSAPNGKVIYPDPGKAGNIFGTTFPKGVWALTFDDGPQGETKAVPAYTQRVLDNLKKHEMKATFFILSQQIDPADCPGIGSRTVRKLDKRGNVISERKVNIKQDRPAVTFPQLARAERDAGHAVASHSYYHSEVPKDTDAEQDCEIRGAIGVFERVVGKKPAFFRLPYGAGVSVGKVRKKIADANLIHVYWSVDTLDWQDLDPNSIVKRTLKAMANGGRGVILFHDIHPQSVIASERIMAYLTDPANHLEAVTIPQIVDRMNGVAPSAPSPKDAKEPAETKPAISFGEH